MTPGRNVLVIDDSVITRTVLCMALKQAGFHTVEAADGMEALERLDRIDLVVCDLHMPRMNGLEFLRKLRSMQATQHVPLLFATVETREEDRAAAKKLGATGWLAKPIDPKQLVQAVERLNPQNSLFSH